MTSELDLSGRWRFRLDPDGIGRAAGWWRETLPDPIELPGSLQAQGYGEEVTAETRWMASRGETPSRFPAWETHPMYARYREPGHVTFPYWLQPRRHYVGEAWYQRDISIPDSWRGRRVVLVLERCHWTSRVWVDDREVGTGESLSTPHTFDLTGLEPGTRRLTICVDNRLAYPIGIDSSSVTDHTQTAWNGIVGRIALEATDLIWLADVQVHAAPKNVGFMVEVGNATGRSATGTLTVSFGGGTLDTDAADDSEDTAASEAGPVSREVEVAVGAEGTTRVSVDLSLPTRPRQWDEFSPALHDIEVRLEVVEEGDGDANEPDHTPGDTTSGRTTPTSASTTSEATVPPSCAHTSTWRGRVGIREFAAHGTRFAVNGRPAFLRGTVECCVFPRHGYPATDLATWREIMAKVREYGLNHVRFHSWCPPEAAFQAADEAGVYLHAECPLWATADDPGLQEYLRREAERILRAYGNHPSFVMFGLGNESYADKAYLQPLLESWKRDRRRLYTGPANDNQSLIEAYDYYIAVHLEGERVRTQMGWPPAPFDSWSVSRPPSTTSDYRAAVGSYPKPLVSHEVGQRCAYPDPAWAAAYDGSLRPGYLEIARDQLAAHGLADQVADFVRASGEWQVEQYKEEIEAALRTPGFGGFQLLQLNDFPGQGTALVGVLDAFWKEKGYVTAARWREFCDATVPLVRMPKRVWTDGETLHADVEVAHFGPAPLPPGRARYEVRGPDGGVVVTGEVSHGQLETGELHRLGDLAVPLAGLDQPATYELVVDVDGHRNRWHFWVYPRTLPPAPADVLVARRLDDETLSRLEAGASVLLLPHEALPPDASPRHGQCFTSSFWNAPWTDGGSTETLGILVATDHPALAAFPTARHTTWQWHELLTHTRPLLLEGWGVAEPWPRGDRPVVAAIDDWNTNRRLALVVEARVGRGRVLVAALDLTTDLDRRVVARQLRHSLLRYLSSEPSEAKVTVTAEQLRALLQRWAETTAV
ncbi:MAG TPA: sugar-binding domain-containing protein [Actinopolymorphaceae bacterium]